jgi:dihydroorotate dehydrogenase electron transfer subunit
MPVDVDALVVDNRQLSADYNVLSLDAPDLARRVQPGQFVMVRPGQHFDPLLRRPFSVFEVLRDSDGEPRGISILNKQVGRGTSAVYGLRPGERLSTLGPLGRPFPLIDPPAEAWMVAGGVGLAPFVTLTEALTARGTPTPSTAGDGRVTCSTWSSSSVTGSGFPFRPRTAAAAPGGW